MDQPSPPAEAPAGRDRWILLAAAALSLAPFVAYRGLFGRLFWYGDELDLIDQMDRQGFWRWMWVPFAENVVPLFKALWVGCLLLFHGSYAAMIALLWVTHALNVGLLGRLMRLCGLPWLAVAPALLLFGLPAAQFETLAWSVQWSAELSTTFLLLAAGSFLGPSRGPAPFAWSLASALSFSRGILTGVLLAGACALPGGDKKGRWARVAGYLVPAAAVAVAIALFADGNQGHMKGHVGEAAVYGAWYYCLNPAHRLLSQDSAGWGAVAVLGSLKLALVAWALVRSRGRERSLFILLVAFDLGYAALLGIGRYHTGLPTSMSSRYQYASLLGIAPLAGFWFARQWERIPAAPWLRSSLAAGLLLSAAGFMVRQWPRELEPFTRERGTRSRQVLLETPNPAPYSVPGVPWLSNERARQLIAKYHLH